MELFLAGPDTIHGAARSGSRLELGPVSSALSGAEEDEEEEGDDEEENGAAMLDGIGPKPPPLAGGAIVAPRSFRSWAGDTGTEKVGLYNSLYCCIGI